MLADWLKIWCHSYEHTTVFQKMNSFNDGNIFYGEMFLYFNKWLETVIYEEEINGVNWDIVLLSDVDSSMLDWHLHSSWK